MAYLNETCQLKDKEREEARKSAIEISCDHADSNHKQTWGVLALVITTFIEAAAYFSHENTARSIDIQKHETNIENMKTTLDKIDSKMDRLMSHVATEGRNK